MFGDAPCGGVADGGLRVVGFAGQVFDQRPQSTPRKAWGADVEDVDAVVVE